MKRKPLEIKKEILKILKEYGEISVKKLERKVNTNYQTILSNCEELEYFRVVKILKTTKGSNNGRSYLLIKLIE